MPRRARGAGASVHVTLHPIGRLGKAEEIAHGVVFLIENEFTTGTHLYIDGGYTAQ